MIPTTSAQTAAARRSPANLSARGRKRLERR